MEWLADFLKDEEFLGAITQIASILIVGAVPVGGGFVLAILRQITRWVHANATAAQINAIQKLADIALSAAKEFIDNLDNETEEEEKPALLQAAAEYELETLMAQYQKTGSLTLAKTMVSEAVQRNAGDCK